MSQWNWSWVSNQANTLRASNSVDQSGGTLYPYRTATRGQISASELNSSIDSISTNINQQWRLWSIYIRPILDSLPSGIRDQRWRTGVGLPEKIDALRYGIQGTTLFVFNDATSTNAYGRYWDSTSERPITIAEAFEDVWEAISDIETVSTSSGTYDDTALWYAVGNRYQSSSLASASSSLDARTSVLESSIAQLSNDIYGASAGYGPYNFGVPLVYSLAENIDALLKLHNVTSGWQADPSGANHTGLGGGATTELAYTAIKPSPSEALSQNRLGTNETLYNDMLRARYEIAQIKGTTYFYEDPTDPVTSSSLSGGLKTHMDYAGSGSQTASNPHAITTAETGANTYFGYVAAFIGMGDYTTNETPTYSSTNYVSDATSLETAIGALDAAIASVAGGNAAIDDWASATSYAENDEALHVGLRFRCLSAHTSSVNFYSDLDHWECVSNEGTIVNQATHGLSGKDVIYQSSGSWAKADASDASKLSDPPTIVVLSSTNYFLMVQDGTVTYTGHGLSQDEVYFLSPTTPGLLTATEPTGGTDYSNPILRVRDANTLTVLPYRPSQVALSGNTYLGLLDTVNSFTAYRIPYANSGATALTDSANFKFNSTDVRLEVGVSAFTPNSYTAADTVAVESNASSGTCLHLSNFGIGAGSAIYLSSCNGDYAAPDYMDSSQNLGVVLFLSLIHI